MNETEPTIANLIEPQRRGVEGFPVGRVLPSRLQRMVGPFAFFDHFGPAELTVGHRLDVRPHPHIGLSTVTYLFEGEVVHRDSLGSKQPILPGAVNWMTAGRGIVHSERSPTPATEPAAPSRVHGLQLWVAAPDGGEEVDPSFAHHPSDSLPELAEPGRRLRVLAGEAYGLASPVAVQSPLFYVEAHLDAGHRLELPGATERAAFLLSGELVCGGAAIGADRLAVFAPGTRPVLEAHAPSHLVLLGGEPIGRRYVWWNFVASSRDRIVEAARAWREHAFPTVPGDEIERIPLTEDVPHFA